MTLAIERGEILYIIGTSGVGKSVAIKLLIGLHRIDGGEIWFDGQRIDQLPERAFAPLRKRIGMVFQSSTLFDSMTLAENAGLPLRNTRRLGLAPGVVLFDEPTTGLDPVSARRIDRLIRELAGTLGVTAVVVSHDPPSIFGIAD